MSAATETADPARGKAAFDRAKTKPIPIPVNADGIPPTLKDSPQWICWQYILRDGLWAKIPTHPKTGEAFISAPEPKNWGTFAEAMATYRRLKLSGVGYVFANGKAGVDLDDCRCPDSGKIEPWAVAVLDKLQTYADISPSRTGVKAFALGSKPGQDWCKEPFFTGEIEMYDQGRFFAITGVPLPGYPALRNGSACGHIPRRSEAQERPPVKRAATRREAEAACATRW